MWHAVAALEDLSVERAEGYLRRSDLSRWIADVFGDDALARELQSYEQEYVQSRSGDALVRIVAAIRSRYELTEENEAVVAYGFHAEKGRRNDDMMISFRCLRRESHGLRVAHAVHDAMADGFHAGELRTTVQQASR